MPQLSPWKADIGKRVYDHGPQTKLVPQTPRLLMQGIKSESRGGTVKKLRWPEIGKVLMAARALNQLSPMGEDLGLLMWSSDGKQRGPDDCKDVLPASERVK